MTGIAIRMSGLFRDFGAVRALDGLSLDVPEGRIFGFLGPNGAGKTTTIHLLLGLLSPTAGSAQVLGLDPWSQGDGVRTQTGALLEETGLYDQLTAAENLAFHARIWGIPDGEQATRIDQALEEADLQDRRDDPVGTFSRGMQRRLALGRALLHRPRLLFLDEPTSGLDVIAANEVRADLATIVAERGVTVFLTTHDMVEAERLCDEVAIIRRGHLVAVGPLDGLRTGGRWVDVDGDAFDSRLLDALVGRPDVVRLERTVAGVRLFLASSGPVAPIVRQIVEAGVDVEEVRRGGASLEEVFLDLMAEDGGQRVPT